MTCHATDERHTNVQQPITAVTLLPITMTPLYKLEKLKKISQHFIEKVSFNLIHYSIQQIAARSDCYDPISNTNSRGYCSEIALEKSAAEGGV